jgi:hypothetical protein
MLHPYPTVHLGSTPLNWRNRTRPTAMTARTAHVTIKWRILPPLLEEREAHPDHGILPVVGQSLLHTV